MARGDQTEVTTLKQREADRYRRATDDALQQLDWSIGYLHGIRKVQIERATSTDSSVDRCPFRFRRAGVILSALP